MLVTQVVGNLATSLGAAGVYARTPLIIISSPLELVLCLRNRKREGEKVHVFFSAPRFVISSRMRSTPCLLSIVRTFLRGIFRCCEAKKSICWQCCNQEPFIYSRRTWIEWYMEEIKAWQIVRLQLLLILPMIFLLHLKMRHQLSWTEPWRIGCNLKKCTGVLLAPTLLHCSLIESWHQILDSTPNK